MDYIDPIEKIVTSTYQNLLQNCTNTNFLQSRAILASTIEIIDEINDYITNLLQGDYFLNTKFFHYILLIVIMVLLTHYLLFSSEVKEFLSSDSIGRSKANGNDAYEHLTP